ncbi:DUF192 domain-containing protein [Collimonas sp. NPDC087041]|uniref:DUF192 domain-containing protein n=1 Tax=Collimonas sp. NPDC087041 TaxID=3363960 RepID=UPI0037FDFBD0
MVPTLHISIARNLWTRAVGLLSRRSLADNEALLIIPCPSIHTWFMRFSIDAVFLDKAGVVTHVVEKIGPWRFVYGKRAYSCLELSAGTARRLDFRVGQQFSALAGSLKVDKLQLDLS